MVSVELVHVGADPAFATWNSHAPWLLRLDGDHMHGTSTVKLPGNEQESDFEANRQPGGAQ